MLSTIDSIMKTPKDAEKDNFDRCQIWEEEIAEVVEEAGRRFFVDGENAPKFLVDEELRIWDIFELTSGSWFGQCEELEVCFSFGPSEEVYEG